MKKAFCNWMKTIGDILVASWCCGAGVETAAGAQIGGFEERKCALCRKDRGY
jgi:hypothetical protein